MIDTRLWNGPFLDALGVYGDVALERGADVGGVDLGLGGAKSYR